MTDSTRQYAQDKLNKKDFDCAKEYTLAMFSGKYKIVILYHLFHDGTMRFNQIQRLLDDATHKMLAQQLKEMCADDLVRRSEKMVDNRKAVFYNLTETGISLIPIVDAMYAWGTERLKQLQVQKEFKLI